MAPRPTNKIAVVLIYEGVQYAIITLGFAVATVVVALISTGLPWRKRPPRE